MAKLGDIIEQIRGVSYKPADLHDNLNNNSVILLRANNIQNGKIVIDDVVYVSKNKVSESQYLRQGDILVCTSSGSKELVGKAAFVDKDLPMVFGAFCKVVRPKIECCEYMGYFFQAPYYRNHISAASAGANINNLRNEHIADLHIPLPSFDEQRKIAAVLDKVSHLISKRRQQLDKLDEMVKARFVEMFGDPVSNPYDWNLKGLLQLGDCKNGMNFHSTDVGVNIHCLGVGDFKNLSCISDTSKLPTVSLTDIPSDEYMLKDGDIVFVRSNGNKALVGRSLVVYPATTPTTFSGFCIRFRLNSDEVKADYLLRVLKTDSIRKKMAGRGANIQNLNQKILGELQIPVPPLDLQNRFASFVEQTEKTKTTISHSLDKLETLKKELMQEYLG